MAAAYSPNDNVMELDDGQGFTAMALRYNANLVLFSLDIPFFVIIVLIENIMGWFFTHDMNTFHTEWIGQFHVSSGVHGVKKCLHFI